MAFTIILVSGTATGRLAFAANTTYWMIRDENSKVGEHQLSVLMSAYLTGKQVYVLGSNTCARWGDGEDINIIEFGH